MPGILAIEERRAGADRRTPLGESRQCPQIRFPGAHQPRDRTPLNAGSSEVMMEERFGSMPAPCAKFLVNLLPNVTTYTLPGGQ
jgi:hypothetical protein